MENSPTGFSCAKRAAYPSNEFAACRQPCGDTQACMALEPSPLPEMTIEQAINRGWVEAVNAAYVRAKRSGNTLLAENLLDVHWFLCGGKYRK